jgi:HAD superfamily hydrolase (TIGR01509 family)
VEHARILLFDIGSTLIEGPDSGPAQRFADLLGIEKRAVRDLLFRTELSGPEDLAARLARQFAAGAARALEVSASLWRAQIEEAYVLPGAREAIARLKQAGIRRGYLSNIWPPFYQRFALEFPEEAASGDCFLSFRTGLMKPDLEAFRAALDRCGVEPSAAVMVGDTYKADIEPALRLGMKAIWILHRPHKERRDLARVLNGEARRPHLTLTSIAELLPEHAIMSPSCES